MEREGRPSKAGDDRRAAKERNEQRAELKAEAKIIDFELARIERDERERQQDRQPSKPALPPAVVYRQKARFEVWANARRADHQTARHTAQGEQGRMHHEQRRDLEQRQAATYAPQLEALNVEAAAIKTRQERGGWLYRITGRAGSDRNLAAQVQAGIDNIGQRKTEQVQALDAHQQARTTRLEARYAERSNQLEKRIEQRRAGREAEGWIPPEAREATTGQEIGREAGKSGVEGRDAGTGQTAPENEQATPAPSEQAREGNSAQETESTPDPSRRSGSGGGWATPEEREAATNAAREAREAREAQEREGSNDNDPGRTLER